MRMLTIPLIVAVCFLSACATATVRINEDTQRSLAAQFAEAELAEGLANHVRKRVPDDVAAPQDKARAAALYNDAAKAHNQVIEQLQMQLAGNNNLLNFDLTDTTAAINKLITFREFAQTISGYSDINPIDPDVYRNGTRLRTYDDLIAAGVRAALAAFSWWIAEQERARQAFDTYLEKKRLTEWTTLD